MSLKYKYALFIFVIHVALIVLLYRVLEEHKWIFIASELLIVVSLVLSYSLYRQLIRPLELMQSGSNALIENDFTIKYVNTGSKEMDKLIEVYNTMIDRLRTERTTMEEQSHFLNKLIEVSPIGMLILDYDKTLTDANPRAIKYLNLPKDWKGKELTEFGNAFAEQIKALEINQPKLIELNGIRKYKCQVSNVMHKGFPRIFILIEELTAEILETEKKAYGKVIRMMAHEVNNSMGAVNSILNTINDFGFDHDDADLDLKSSLEVAITRNEGLGVFMENFAKVIRLPAPNMTSKNLNEVVRNACVLYERRAQEQNISITYELSQKELWITMDQVQMEQVLANIIKNAIESIERDGIINVITTSSPVGFIIQDDGPGISDEKANQIFSPFYSTKPTGQGIGLILCRDILQNHGATFSLETNKETGLTAFRVAF